MDFCSFCNFNKNPNFHILRLFEIIKLEEGGPMLFLKPRVMSAVCGKCNFTLMHSNKVRTIPFDDDFLVFFFFSKKNWEILFN